MVFPTALSVTNTQCVCVHSRMCIILFCHLTDTYIYNISLQKRPFNYSHFICKLVLYPEYIPFQQYTAFLLLTKYKNLIHRLLINPMCNLFHGSHFLHIHKFCQPSLFLIWYYWVSVSKLADRGKNVLSSGHLNL